MKCFEYPADSARFKLSCSTSPVALFTPEATAASSARRATCFATWTSMKCFEYPAASARFKLSGSTSPVALFTPEATAALSARRATSASTFLTVEVEAMPVLTVCALGVASVLAFLASAGAAALLTRFFVAFPGTVKVALMKYTSPLRVSLY